jgi:hypothetical protein
MESTTRAAGEHRTHRTAAHSAAQHTAPHSAGICCLFLMQLDLCLWRSAVKGVELLAESNNVSSILLRVHLSNHFLVLDASLLVSSFVCSCLPLCVRFAGFRTAPRARWESTTARKASTTQGPGVRASSMDMMASAAGRTDPATKAHGTRCENFRRLSIVHAIFPEQATGLDEQLPSQARDKHNDESWLKQSGSMSCVCSLSSLCLSYVGLPPYLRGLGDAWRDDLDGGRARRLQVGRAMVSETHAPFTSHFRDFLYVCPKPVLVHDDRVLNRTLWQDCWS